MKNGLKVLALASFLGVCVAQAGPIEVRTQFRPRIEASRIKVELPTMAALRERVAQDASVHANVLMPMIASGGFAGEVKVFDPAVMKAGSKKAFADYEAAHEALLKEMAKFSGEGGKAAREPSSEEFENLRKLYEARDEALNNFRNKGENEGFISVKDKGHWDFAAKLAVATGGKPTTGLGSGGNSGNHDASSASRATKESVLAKPGDSYDAVMKGLSTTFKDHPSIQSAIESVYGEKAMDAAGGTEAKATLKEKAVLVTAKAEAILRDLMRMGNALKFAKLAKGQEAQKIRELMETIIKSEAGPDVMEALRQTVTKFDEDAGAGMSRMVTLDKMLRDGGVPKGKLGEKMSEWLSAGEDFRSLVTPDMAGKSDRDKAILSSLAQAAREFWMKDGTLPETSKVIERAVQIASNKNKRTFKGNLEAKDFAAHIEAVDRAKEKLRLAKEGKGEDAALEHAVCSADCKGPFKCRGG